MRAIRKFGSLGSALCAAALSACTPVSVLNSTVGSQGYRVEKDIPFGELSRHMLDLYIPDDVKPDAPVVVFFYGGSWKMGDKRDYKFAAQGLTTLGYVVAVPDYRLYPQARYPAFLEDCAQAVVWVYRNLPQHGISPENLYLMGHSAGAYNAAMLALEPSYLKKAGGNVKWLRGVVGLAGAYDFLPITGEDIKLVFASEEQLERTQPVHYARANAPRMLLLTGSEDSIVYPTNSQSLAKALKGKGSDATYREYKGVGHIGIILGLNTSFPWNKQVRQDIAAFIAEKP